MEERNLYKFSCKLSIRDSVCYANYHIVKFIVVFIHNYKPDG